MSLQAPDATRRASQARLECDGTNTRLDVLPDEPRQSGCGGNGFVANVMLNDLDCVAVRRGDRGSCDAGSRRELLHDPSCDCLVADQRWMDPAWPP
jgi:hypothetical protein